MKLPEEAGSETPEAAGRDLGQTKALATAIVSRARIVADVVFDAWM